MTDPSSSIVLEEFEQTEAAPGTALLRITARPSAGVLSQGRPTLVVDDGSRLHRLCPLPAPPDPSGVLRVGFSAPLELLQGPTAFALELPDQSVLELPGPTQRIRGSAGPGRPEVESDLADERSPAAAELEEAQTRAQMLEQVVRAESERRSWLERELTEVSEARTQALSAIEELRSGRAELESQIAMLTAERSSLVGRAEALTSLLASARDELEKGAAESERADREVRRHARDRDKAKPREAALVTGRTSRAAAPRVAATHRELPTGRGRHPGWLPSEAALGSFLVILGLVLAALILTGEVRLGFAP